MPTKIVKISYDSDYLLTQLWHRTSLIAAGVQDAQESDALEVVELSPERRDSAWSVLKNAVCLVFKDLSKYCKDPASRFELSLDKAVHHTVYEDLGVSVAGITCSWHEGKAKVVVPSATMAALKNLVCDLHVTIGYSYRVRTITGDEEERSGQAVMVLSRASLPADGISYVNLTFDVDTVDRGLGVEKLQTYGAMWHESKVVSAEETATVLPAGDVVDYVGIDGCVRMHKVKGLAYSTWQPRDHADSYEQIDEDTSGKVYVILSHQHGFAENLMTAVDNAVEEAILAAAVASWSAIVMPTRADYYAQLSALKTSEMKSLITTAEQSSNTVKSRYF